MWCVLNAFHSYCLQASELVKDVEELTDAKVLLNLRLANELHVAEYKLLQTASKVLTV